MVLAVVMAVLAVTELGSVAVSVLPVTTGLLSTVIAALPYMAILTIPVILVVWLAQK